MPEHELTITFTTSSGPGGQNVNKVNTCAEVRFHVPSAWWVGDEAARARLVEAERGRVNKVTTRASVQPYLGTVKKSDGALRHGFSI